MPRHDSGWWPLRARGLLDELIEFPHDRAEPPKTPIKGQHPLATRIMSNGVGVIVADANADDQSANQKSKLLRGLPTRPMSLSPSTLDDNVRITVTAPEKQTNNSSTRQSAQLLSSSTSISTERNTRHPVLQLKHNYVIKTCFTTFTYLTTLIRKSRTIVSTYETVVSTVTTEPLIITPTLTHFDTKTKQNDKTPSLFQATQLVQNTLLSLPKIEKRIDDLLQNLAADDDDDSDDEEENDIIEPSEVAPSSNSCSLTSCPCTVTLTESLKDNKLQTQIEDTPLQLKRSPLKSTKYGSTVIDIAPTGVVDHKGEKHTKKPSKNNDKINTDGSGENIKDKIKNNNHKNNQNSDKPINDTKNSDDKRKPENKDTQKPPQKTKFQVADLLKLGTLGIKKLAPMIEQMTGTLKKRQEELTKQTFKPATTITPYIVNKRIDSIDSGEQKPGGKFPIYIPVDEDLEVAESQNAYVNSTLHQNLLWASQNLKNSRNNIGFGKPLHESPLVNGGIPISPGEIITANSDVIVGKPAVGGPILQEMKPNHPDLINNNGPSFLDSHSQASTFQDTRARPPPPQRGQGLKHIPIIRDDDSFDLKPPMMPMPKPNLPPPHQHMQSHHQANQNQQAQQPNPHHPGHSPSQTPHLDHDHPHSHHHNQGHPQRPEFTGPQRPEFSGPQRPEFNGPQRIEFNGPQRVEFNGPQRPEFNGPQRPEFNGPQIPEFNGPQRPDFNGPQRPEFNGQQRPDFNGPQRLEFNGPQRPDFNGPQRPEFNGPQRPEFNGPQRIEFNGPQRPEFIGPHRQEFNGPQRPEFNGPPRPHPNLHSDQIISENRPIGRPAFIEDDNKPHNTLIDHIGGSIHPPIGSENHGRPMFLDYIPSLGSEESFRNSLKNNLITRKNHEDGTTVNNLDKIRPTPSKVWANNENKHIPIHFEEHVYKPIKEAPEPILLTDLVHKSTVKPFLVDIQPSRVANVIIPHGSSTALIFSGTSEPHKNGEYIDDPLPYSEPGYFGSFSIDAPHLTSVHVGGKIPMNPNGNIQHHGDHRMPHSGTHDNIPSRNNPEPSIINHGVSGLNQDGKPPSGHRWKYDDAAPSKNFRGPPPGALPPPISNQEHHIHFGPHRPKKPEQSHVVNMNFGPDVNIPPPVGNLHFNEGVNKVKTTTSGYEDELAVPPPPLPTVQVKFESNVGVLNSEYERLKNGGNLNLRPQDNIPLPNNIHSSQQRPFAPHKNDIPPRITSEVYFASQAPNSDRFSQKLPPFTVDLPDPNKFNQYRPHLHQPNIAPRPETVHFPGDGTKFINTFDGGLVTLNAGTKVNIPNVAAGHVDVSPLGPQNNIGSGISGSHFTIPQQGGLITLNAGASVHGVNFPEQTISGTSISAPGHHPISNQINYHEIKEFNSHVGESTGIPIGTNFAIKVEPHHIQHYEQNIKVGVPSIPIQQSGLDGSGPEIIVGGNSWKAGPIRHDSEEDDTNRNINGIPDSIHNGNEKVHVIHASTISEFNITHIKNSGFSTVQNSHANFPVTKESILSLPTTTAKSIVTGKKDVTTKVTINKSDKNAGFISNQHAGISHVQPSYIELFDRPKPTQDLQNHLYIAYPTSNVKPQTNSEKEAIKPHEKIVKKPNADNEVRFGDRRPPVPSPPSISYNWETIPKPFEKPILKPKPTLNTVVPDFVHHPPQTYSPSYIPTTFGDHQPVYDIPKRDKVKPIQKSTPKPATYTISSPSNVFVKDTTLNKGEIGSGSAKIPVFSSTPIIVSNEVTVNYDSSINKTTRPQKVMFNADNNRGSQTEEPFDKNKYNVPGGSPVTQNPITPHYGQLAPRPFTLKDNDNNIVDKVRVDMPNPRPFRKQPQSENDNMSLNIGEIQIQSTTPSTVTKKPFVSESTVTKSTRRPIHRNTTSYYINDNEKPSTAATRKPIRTRTSTTKSPTTLIDITTKASNDSMIISNLSPPPPTNDYSFKPTGGDETIMGMSPPPKTPSPKPGNEYSKYNDISTYRPSFNTQKIPFRRPVEINRIPSRPFSRFTTPSTIRMKPSAGTTTITRIVYSSRSTPWRNPIRGDSKTASSIPIILPTAVEIPSIINTQPNTVGPDIMHPDTYPEENIGFVNPNLIAPDRVVVPQVYSTAIRSPGQSVLAPSIISAPSVVYRPSILQGSEKFHKEHINKETERINPSLTISLEENSRKPIRTSIHKYTSSIGQQITTKSKVNDLVLKPVHHGGNEVKQSDDFINLEKVTAVTYTTTLSEPASTVLTTKFVTLTHTLTVTQTKTSVVSPVVDSTTQTQTLVLTNTHTSTVVDIVTEIHTLVQPTTIVQTITKHVPITTLPSWETKYPQVPLEPTSVKENSYKTKGPVKLDDVSLSSDEDDFIIRPDEEVDVASNSNTTSEQEDKNTFFVVMNKSQNGGNAPSIPPVLEDDDFDGATRNEEIDSNGLYNNRILLGEILLAGTPYMERDGVRPSGSGYGKECQPECQASRNERCQRTHGLMRCVCRPGFARMFPDRPCKPTYTYNMKLALSRYGRDRLLYQDSLADQTSQSFQTLAEATHEGINRMVMQSDLRDVYHGVHVNGFLPVTIPAKDGSYTGVVNDFYVQLSDNAHENRLKEVIEKYLRTNNYSLGGSEVYAAGELVDKLEVGDFNECASVQFHDCSEHAECFNLRASYTCSCREGYADLSPNPLYPGRMCSAEAVGCEKCHYHGTCYNRDDSILCECFQWYSGEYCQINLKVILISLSTLGALLLIILMVCLVLGCARRRRTRPHPMMAACLAPHQSTLQSSKHHPTLDKRALIQERGNDSGGEGSSVHNAPYVPPPKKISQISQKSKKSSTQESCEKGKPFTLMIPRAKYCPGPTSPLELGRENPNGGRRKSSCGDNTAEAKLLNYLEGGPQEHLSRRKQSNESSYSVGQSSIPKKYSTGALVSAGFKVSTTVTEEVRVKEPMRDDDEVSSITKSHTMATLDMQSQYNSLRKAYSNEDMNDWTDAERRIGELTMSEARSFDGTLVKPAQKLMRSTTGSNKSSAHYTQHEANTMAERDLGSTFLLPHVHLYKPDLGSDVSEFDSL